MSSLPPLLLERLKKRGIIKEVVRAITIAAKLYKDTRNLAASGATNEEPAEEEEVFAESYDREDELDAADAGDKYRGGAPGCPNKYNPYHLCTDFCFEHWREGYPESRLNADYMEARAQMLKRFPLPVGWREIYDAGTRRHYYWCAATDLVSWVSPRHPKAVITEAAPKLAREIYETEFGVGTAGGDKSISGGGKKPAEYENGKKVAPAGGGAPASTLALREQQQQRPKRYDKEARDARRRAAMMPLEEDELVETAAAGSDDEQRVELSDRDRLKRAKRRGIDPMDPAAYGDAPVGAWSAGLTSDTKTGVDVTANGPLFQQRPYPAPGAILRKNNPNANQND